MAKTIELLWEILEMKDWDNNDREKIGGIYQIYGTHPIYGRNVLLYIGKTNGFIGDRIKQHLSAWIKYEYDEVTIHYGSLSPTSKFEGYSKMDAFAAAEALLVYYCAPAYNSNLILRIDEKYLEGEIVVRNYKKLGSLPTEVSTGWYKSEVWREENFKG